MSHDNYRSYLKGELVGRIARNPSYSLRLFAQELGLSPSTLSEVMSGRKNLSYRRAMGLSQRLGHTPKETDYFCSLVQLASAKRMEEKQQLSARIQTLNPKAQSVDLSLEYFSVIAEWYHLPILALTEVERFRMTPDNVARRLGISRLEAEVAMRRLVKLELMRETGPGRYAKAHEHMCFKTDEINRALQHFHRQMLQKAIAALTTQTNQEKIVGSQTFAFDPAQLPAAKEKIETFFAELMAFFDQGKAKTQVYHLSLGLFNLRGDKP